MYILASSCNRAIYLSVQVHQGLLCDQFIYTCVSSPVTVGLGAEQGCCRVQLSFHILPWACELPVQVFQGLDCNVMWCSFCPGAVLLNNHFKGTSGPSLVFLGSNAEFLSQGSWTATAGGPGTELALFFLSNKWNIVFVLKYLRGPASWSSGQSLWLLIMRSRVRFPVLPWEFFLAGKDSCGDHGLGS